MLTVIVLVILTLRTWAVWNKDWRLSIGLPIFLTVCKVPMIVISIFLNFLVCESTILSPSLVVWTLKLSLSKSRHIQFLGLLVVWR
jgi:hypothetical protein